MPNKKSKNFEDYLVKAITKTYKLPIDKELSKEFAVIKKSFMGDRKIKNSICPRCHGTGISRAFARHPKYSEKVRDKAVKLFDAGLSYRQIAKKLKIHSPQTIKNILSYR